MAKKHSGGHKGGSGKSSKAMKYLIKADLKVNGNVQRKDIIGAIMGLTEGLLCDDLELRNLQRTARIGHVDVEGVFYRIDKHWRGARSRNAAGCGKECE